jgi:hypothetical protein
VWGGALRNCGLELGLARQLAASRCRQRLPRNKNRVARKKKLTPLFSIFSTQPTP